MKCLETTLRISFDKNDPFLPLLFLKAWRQLARPMGRNAPGVGKLAVEGAGFPACTITPPPTCKSAVKAVGGPLTGGILSQSCM